jgi:hypothetical protein
MKIMLKVVLLVPVFYIFSMPVYYIVSSGSKPCSGIKIIIKDSADYHFVTKQHLLNLINSKNVKGRSIKDVPVDEIEKMKLICAK